MSSILTTITTLKSLYNDDFAKQMHSQIVGYLGELIVREKLESEAVEVEHFGGQGGYDLYCKDLDAKIDVKTSTPQSEFLKITEIMNYGWALKREPTSEHVRPLRSTHIVCVELNEDLSVNRYHVIKSQDVTKFPKPSSGRYGRVAHGFVTPILPDVLTDSKGFQKAFRKFSNKTVLNHVRTVQNFESLKRAIEQIRL